MFGVFYDICMAFVDGGCDGIWLERGGWEGLGEGEGEGEDINIYGL